MKIVKEPREAALKLAAKAVNSMANIAAESHCIWFTYEPKIPEKLRMKKSYNKHV